MDLTIIPGKLSGDVRVPSSKSVSHRALICAALADGVSYVRDITMSQDIYATIDTLTELGAEFEVNEKNQKIISCGNDAHIIIMAINGELIKNLKFHKYVLQKSVNISTINRNKSTCFKI